jgi:hypothetical protein
MSIDLNAKIEQISKIVETRRDEAEKALWRLIPAVAAAVTAQLPEYVERYLTQTHAELTSRLSDRIARVKSELGALIDSMPTQVRRWLDRDGYWQHRRGYAGAPDKFHGSYGVSHHPVGGGWEPPVLGSAVQAPVRELVATLLKKFGYPAPRTYESFFVRWDDIVPAINEYADAVQKFRGAEQTYAGAIRDKKQQDAKAIWSKA